MVSNFILGYLCFILSILTGSQATQATLLDSLQAALPPKNIISLFFNGKLEESSPNISWTLQNRDSPRDPFLNDPVSDNREDLASANGPMLRSNWVDHCDAKLRTKRAVAEALELARGALDDLRFKGEKGRNYARYFSKIPFRTVWDGFYTLFDPHTSPPLLTTPFQDTVPNIAFLQMDLRYDAPRDPMFGAYYSKACSMKDGKGGAAASIWQGPPMAPLGLITSYSRALVVLCPAAFKQLDLPDSNLGEDDRCNMFREVPFAHFAMQTLSAYILHEFIHWAVLTGTTPGPDSDDRVVRDYPNSDDPIDDDGDPPNGYGPYNAMRLRQKPGHEPEFNADSYVWFALEVWWSRKCGVSLVDPLNTKEAVFPIGAVQDFIVGGPEN